MNEFKSFEIHLVYQPKVNLNTLEIIGLEALVRFSDSKSKKKLNTENIIDSITNIDEMLSLTDKVFDKVISDIKILDKLKCEINISINMSSKELCNINLSNWIDEKINKYGKYISRIEIEITDKYEVKDKMVMKERINLLRKRGFFVSLDDLGSGFNQIEMIEIYEVDLIKIDKSMVRNFTLRKNELDYISNMSKKRNIKLLVEGIEADRDLKRFLKLGVEFGQGYYFYKPMKFDEILEKINLLKNISN